MQPGPEMVRKTVQSRLRPQDNDDKDDDGVMRNPLRPGGRALIKKS